MYVSKVVSEACLWQVSCSLCSCPASWQGVIHGPWTPAGNRFSLPNWDLVVCEVLTVPGGRKWDHFCNLCNKLCKQKVPQASYASSVWVIYEFLHSWSLIGTGDPQQGLDALQLCDPSRIAAWEHLTFVIISSSASSLGWQTDRHHKDYSWPFPNRLRSERLLVSASFGRRLFGVATVTSYQFWILAPLCLVLL